MRWGVIASCPAVAISTPPPPRIQSILPQRHSSSARNGVRRNCIADSAENESKTAFDAFFVGKAFGEALNERLESGLGEFLSVITGLQAQQQKQLLEFQEEVLEKARRAKEQASREVIEAQGPTTVGGASNSTSPVSDKDPFIGLFKD